VAGQRKIVEIIDAAVCLRECSTSTGKLKTTFGA
jgi:hypothetical protein